MCLWVYVLLEDISELLTLIELTFDLNALSQSQKNI